MANGASTLIAIFLFPFSLIFLSHIAECEEPSSSEGLVQFLLESDDPTMRMSAAEKLAQAKVLDSQAIKKILVLLKDKRNDALFMHYLITALSKASNDSDELVLNEIEKCTDSSSRAALLNSIALRKKLLDKHFEVGIRNIKDHDHLVCMYSILIISRFPEKSELAVDKLIEIIKQEDEGLKGQALFALGRFGRGSARAVPDLLLMLDTNDQYRIASVLYVINKSRTIVDGLPDKISKYIGDDYGLVLRLNATVSLVIHKGMKEEYLVAFKDGMKSRNPSEKSFAIECIGSNKKTCERFCEELVCLLADKDDTILTSAIYALSQNRIRPEEVVPQISAIVSSTVIADVRKACVRGLFEYSTSYSGAKELLAKLKVGGDAEIAELISELGK